MLPENTVSHYQEMTKIRGKTQEFIDAIALAIRDKDMDKISENIEALIALSKDVKHPDVVLEALTMACASIALQQQQAKLEAAPKGSE